MTPWKDKYSSQENKKDCKEEDKTRWNLEFSWNNIQDKWPSPNTEVIIFYMVQDDGEGVSFFRSTIINEKCINNIKSPLIYWINPPS
jgi:hypothetical protein